MSDCHCTKISKMSTKYTPYQDLIQGKAQNAEPERQHWVDLAQGERVLRGGGREGHREPRALFPAHDLRAGAQQNRRGSGGFGRDSVGRGAIPEDKKVQGDQAACL